MSNTDYYYFRGMLNELKSHTTDLASHSDHLEILKDTVVEINNNEIGDASDGVRCFVYGHDEPNGKARTLFMDSSHNLKVKDDDALIEATSTNTKLDTANSHLEILKDTVVEINNNAIGDASDGVRCFVFGHDSAGGKARALFMDSSHNLKVKDDDLLTKATELDTAIDLNNSRGDELYMDTHVSMISNGSIGAGAFSVVIDMVASTGYQYRTITIYGSTTSATGKLHFSGSDASGGTYYINPTSAALQVDNAGSDYHFIMSWENCPFRYVKVYASVVSSGLYLNHIKTKHR